MSLANIKRRKIVAGKGIVKLKRCEQKTIYNTQTFQGQTSCPFHDFTNLCQVQWQAVADWFDILMSTSPIEVRA